MRRLLAGLVLVAAVAGCGPALPSATQYPAPVGSAAQPAVAARGDLAFARRGMESIRLYLREVDEGNVALVGQQGINLPDAHVAARCAYADGEFPVLVCHYGPAMAQPVAQAIFWYAQDTWQSQLYPQAPLPLAAYRAEALAEQGCRVGCYSAIVRARQQPSSGELLVVVDLGYTSGRHAEEVQVLRLDDSRWQVVWAPGAGDWNYGDTRVELTGKSIAQFRVRSTSWQRQDVYSGYLNEPEAGEHRRFAERWERKGNSYVVADRAEEPGPYSSLVHLIHYLSVGGDEKAAALVSEELPLDEVRRALVQKPRRQGWAVTRWGDHGFLLDTRNTGKPDLGVRFEQQGSEWVLAEVWHPPH